METLLTVAAILVLIIGIPIGAGFLIGTGSRATDRILGDLAGDKGEES